MKRTDNQRKIEDLNLPAPCQEGVVEILRERLHDLRVENDKPGTEALRQRGRIHEVKEILRWFGETP